MRWLRRLWQKSLTERRLDSELQFHLEQQIAGYVSAGVPLDEARRRACIEFGGVWIGLQASLAGSGRFL